jgi:replicative DNA helicase
MSEIPYPHNADAERAALGAFLIDPDFSFARAHWLTPDDFYVVIHSILFEAICALHKDGKPIDYVVLVDHLDRNGKLGEIGGAAYITELIHSTPTAIQVEHYARIVRHDAGLRGLQLELQACLQELINGKYRDRDADIVAGNFAIRLKSRAVVPPSATAGSSSWADLEELIGPIEWAWEGWLPKGLLTIVVGEPGSGKSALILRLCSTWLKGDLWPDGTRCSDTLGAVVWCEAEASQAINLERANKWDLPVDKILAPFADPLMEAKIDDLRHQRVIEEAAQRDDVRFVIVDSLSGASSRDENTAEIKSAVQWLAELARDTGKPIVLTHHLRKRGLLDVDHRVSLERVRGHSSIVQFARMVWALDTPDPNDEETRRLAVIKSNLARFPEPLGLRVTEQGVLSCSAPEPPRSTSVIDQAIEALRTLLEHGPMPATEIFVELREMGVSESTARRAQRKLGIKPRKEARAWMWGLPAAEEDSLPI